MPTPALTPSPQLTPTNALQITRLPILGTADALFPPTLPTCPEGTSTDPAILEAAMYSYYNNRDYGLALACIYELYKLEGTAAYQQQLQRFNQGECSVDPSDQRTIYFDHYYALTRIGASFILVGNIYYAENDLLRALTAYDLAAQDFGCGWGDSPGQTRMWSIGRAADSSRRGVYNKLLG
jgi:hypothetical protein